MVEMLLSAYALEQFSVKIVIVHNYDVNSGVRTLHLIIILALIL